MEGGLGVCIVLDDKRVENFKKGVMIKIVKWSREIKEYKNWKIFIGFVN